MGCLNSTISTKELITSLTPMTRAQVSKHNKPDDCWVVIDDIVYDLTAYKDVHPGNPNMILQYAGKDATGPFREYGHSPFATAQLFSLGVAVGKIKELQKFNKKYYEETYHSKMGSPDIEDFFAGKEEPMFC